MRSVFFVGIGGASGAILRFLLSKINPSVDFPLMTFLINFFGSFLIGIIFELVFDQQITHSETWLFWQTGFCGGFTTLSTMSLETITLFNDGKLILGASYALSSVLASLVGVVGGKSLVKILIK